MGAGGSAAAKYKQSSNAKVQQAPPATLLAKPQETVKAATARDAKASIAKENSSGAHGGTCSGIDLVDDYRNKSSTGVRTVSAMETPSYRTRQARAVAAQKQQITSEYVSATPISAVDGQGKQQSTGMVAPPVPVLAEAAPGEVAPQKPWAPRRPWAPPPAHGPPGMPPLRPPSPESSRPTSPPGDVIANSAVARMAAEYWASEKKRNSVAEEWAKVAQQNRGTCKHESSGTSTQEGCNARVPEGGAISQMLANGQGVAGAAGLALRNSRRYPAEASKCHFLHHNVYDANRAERCR